MNDAIQQMLAQYKRQTREDHINALREIMQQIALLGLWRAKFFEHAAFYGGTALRILYGLDRYSEDLDFSLLRPDPEFTLDCYGNALCRELNSFGFKVEFEVRDKTRVSAIKSAFLKANTIQQLLVIHIAYETVRQIHAGQTIKIKLEVDTDPPPEFNTESRIVLLPIPFAVRTYTRPDLFAGKMHAVLCRKWKTRVKGRDWYDMVWYISHHPHLNLSYLESCMRKSGNYQSNASLNRTQLMDMLHTAINRLNVSQARDEVEKFVKDKSSLEIWSREFFLQITDNIKT